MDVLVDDAVDLHHQVGIVRVFSLLLQALVDGENCVFPGAHGIVHIVRVCVAEQPRQFRRIGLEGFLGFQRLAHRVDCILYKAHLFKVLCVHQFLQPEPVFCQKAVRFSDDRANTLDQLRFIHRWINTRRAVLADRIICQSLAQRLYDTNIVHDQAVALALRNTVCTSNSLHQGMGFQRLVQIQTGQILYIKARQPHGTDEHHPERILAVLEFFIQLPLFHFGTVRQNIQPPLFEGLHLVLLLTDHHCHFGFFHPCQFAGKLLCFLLGHCALPGFQFPDLCPPVFLHIVVHPHTGDLIQADEHRLAAGPKVRVMLHKVPCNGTQPFICGENMDLLCKLAFQLFLLRGIKVGCFNGIQNPPGDLRLVQLGDLIRTVLIIQRHRCAVLHRPLEVIHRQIPAKGALGDMVICQKWRTGKADAGCRGQQVHHVVCKNAVLTAVGFIRQNQNVVIRVDRRLLGQIELLDQGKHKAGVALQLFYKVCTAGCNEL